jgi:DNA polymerase
LSAAWTAAVHPPWDAEAWRALARHALRAELPPEQVSWEGDAAPGLFGAPPVSAAPLRREAPAVPSGFLALAEAVLCHRDAQRHALLYRLLWRLTHGEPRLLERATDADVRRAEVLAKAVSRDTHKMKAFVRFRAVAGEDDAFLAWFEPEHFVVDRVSGFFMRRFAGMCWAILTPYRSVRWDGAHLLFGEGATRADAPAEDAREDLWRTYYANIFNPARANPSMMQSEMPRKYWRNLPEAPLIPGLLDASAGRVQAMAEREAQAPRRRIPAAREQAPAPIDDLAALNQALQACRRCELFAPATQAVAGEGPRRARILVVGEQPGDREDLAGRPFVGPAGQLFDRALADAGIARDELYLTNAVKHFRFEQRGKARLHKNPAIRHVAACSEWLQREVELVQPQAIVCLGATAARAVLGPAFRLAQQRGEWQRLEGGVPAMATVHPSWVLRLGDGERAAGYAGLVADLRRLMPAP